MRLFGDLRRLGDGIDAYPRPRTAPRGAFDRVQPIAEGLDVVARRVLRHAQRGPQLDIGHAGFRDQVGDHILGRDLRALRLVEVLGVHQEPAGLRDDDAALVAHALADGEPGASEPVPVVLHEDDDVAPAAPLAEHVGDAPLAAALRLLQVDQEHDREVRVLGEHDPEARVHSLDVAAPRVDLRRAGRGVDDQEQRPVVAQPSGDPHAPLGHGERRAAAGRGHQRESVVASAQGVPLEPERVQHGRLAPVVFVGVHLGEVEHWARADDGPGAREGPAGHGHTHRHLEGEERLSGALFGGDGGNASGADQIADRLHIAES